MAGKYTIRIFGESHGPEIGVEIEGVPRGTVFDLFELQAFLDRRAPGNGQGGVSTSRQEDDRPVFTAGLKDGVADGGLVRAVIRNNSVRPSDYDGLSTVPRPGHADYAAWLKDGRIPSGGGRWSGRLTAPLCIAGGLAKQLLAKRGISVDARVVASGTPEADDSSGGIVEIIARGVPAGLGDSGSDGLESVLSAALFGIPAVKGVEFGDGFRLAAMKGSEANDAFVVRDGKVTLATNHCGGILGGVSVGGVPIVVRVAFKPTPSIAKEQASVDLKTLKPVRIRVQGRHDRCIAFRGAVAAEAAVAVALSFLMS